MKKIIGIFAFFIFATSNLSASVSSESTSVSNEVDCEDFAFAALELMYMKAELKNEEVDGFAAGDYFLGMQALCELIKANYN